MSEEALVAIILVPILAIVFWIIYRGHTRGKSVIKKFMEAGQARDVEAAHACWSAECATKGEIARLIESSHDLFTGYKHLTIRSMSGSRTISSSCYSMEGSIIYDGHKRLPFKARLVEEDGVFGITSMQIGSTRMMDVVKSPSISLGGPPGPVVKGPSISLGGPPGAGS
jgi:hypothetical protein